ncbi:DUF3717 domain-containing protein [Glaciimonas soli]|uniref:DUF3717 domain-containing protein n=1 Tax=Glaciimonas soli TaxID=2590999 RepID=A0A843YME0_9BURK|nr:DUF3717 domain-containing protein [Glaciimonas soli]MQR00625.1 DUF3717 domain-containing protein [Glaciimonas soli]
MTISLQELEQAINYWRIQRPATGEECALSPEVNALASVYALMIFHQTSALPFEMIDTIAQQLINAWRNQKAL